MRAVINGHDTIVELLVEAGADTQIRATGTPGFAGKTALDLAHERGQERIAECLDRAAGRHRDEPT
jgi:ankyrin repeat protein